MVDVETQIAALAHRRAEQVEPWRPGPSALRPPESRSPRWRSRRTLVGAAGIAAAAAIVAVILIPDDDTGGRVTTTVPSTTAAPETTTTATPPTVTVTVAPPVAPDATITPVSGAPGSTFRGSTRLVDARLIPMTPQSSGLWLVSPEPGPEGQVTSGLAGTVTFDPSGTATFEGVVPQVMASIENDEFPAGEVFATEPGVYRITFGDYGFISPELDDGYGLNGVMFTVTARGAGLPSEADGHVPNPDRAVLDGDALAGVRIGTGAAEAIAALTERFGPPDSDTGWENACLTERRVVWGGLTAWFVAPDVFDASQVTDGEFGWYLYGPSTGATADLETPSGVRIGSTLTDLRGREPTVGWFGGYDSRTIDRWQTAGGAMGALSEQVIGAAPVVTSIGAGGEISSPFTVC